MVTLYFLVAVEAADDWSTYSPNVISDDIQSTLEYDRSDLGIETATVTYLKTTSKPPKTGSALKDVYYAL